jgi:hypothetical protein
MVSASTLTNCLATIENLNMVGTFDDDNAALDSAIPFDTIGLYQLIEKIIADLVNIKNTIKVNEKNLLKDIAADHAGIATSAVELTQLQAGNITGNDGDATHHSNIADHETRGRRTVNQAPAIFQVVATTHLYTEDAIFSIFSFIAMEIFKLKNGVNGQFQAETAARAGLSNPAVVTVLAGP